MTFPKIIRKDGSILKSGIAAHFSARGCPNAPVGVAVAMIKAGIPVDDALRLSVLSLRVKDLSIHGIEKDLKHIRDVAEIKHAEKFPNGKCAEDIAARREGRPSRWGTPEFHQAKE